jgi:hypothetical protein
LLLARASVLCYTRYMKSIADLFNESEQAGDFKAQLPEPTQAEREAARAEFERGESTPSEVDEDSETEQEDSDAEQDD